jgi:hypothetical protein
MTVSPRQLRGLGWLLYSVALLFVASPLLEVLASSYPYHPGTASWRFGALGLLAQSLPVPVFGILLAFLAATLLEQRGMQTLLSLLCGLGAAALVVVAIAFALDALQLRNNVNRQALANFDITIARAGLIILYCAATLVLCAVLGMRARRPAERESRHLGLGGRGHQSQDSE